MNANVWKKCNPSIFLDARAKEMLLLTFHQFELGMFSWCRECGRMSMSMSMTFPTVLLFVKSWNFFRQNSINSCAVHATGGLDTLLERLWNFHSQHFFSKCLMLWWKLRTHTSTQMELNEKRSGSTAKVMRFYMLTLPTNASALNSTESVL